MSRLANVPAFSLSLGPDRKERDLGQVFRCLGRSKGQYCVTVSRFRRVLDCPRSKMRTVVHSCVRFLPGICFMFSNDRRRVVRRVFLSTGHPFFRDSLILSLPYVRRPICQRFTGHLLSSRRELVGRSAFSCVCRRSSDMA